MDIKIDTRIINENSPCFIIAELSANHNQNIDIAKQTIKAAKESGADAIKLQTYTPDTMTIDCDNEYFKIKQGTVWDGTTLYKLYEKAYTPWHWHKELKEYAQKLGLIFFSTPFDKSATDFLEEIGVEVYKVASFEITDIPLIEYIASKGKPMIISTGIATLQDLELVVNTCKKVGNDKIILLKCTSSYPAKLEDCNLLTILDLKERFNVISGLSDHSMEIEVPITAVALGGKVIEKHFILDRNIGGLDSGFSMEPEEFKKMVDSIRKVEKSLGIIDYELTEKKKKNRQFSRSLFVVNDMKAGEVITEDNVRPIRPGFGMHPKYYNYILGKKIKQDTKKGTPLTFEIIE
ncbi:pseudaminic acid synthase [Terrisporobacter mayombei]|uniref:pseudaminic acid synthase n=1 Tax=Terrisporobacter mayombei TaxID=1541 RepID=UPI00265A4EAD|nr:pseudaminic acid synthase [Terrisporobacter mayombei]MCC3669566.1 pseudaminic acid synthase [Terrisporobacter mayombei]